MSMRDRIRAILYEEGFKDRSDSEINIIINEHKPPEFKEQCKRLLKKKNETGSRKDTLNFYEYCSELVGKYDLQKLLSSNNSKTTEFYLNEIAEKIKPNDKIIDVGCGSGFITRSLARLYPDAYFVGVDISDGLLTRAREEAERRNVKNVEFMHADMDHLYQQLSDLIPNTLPFDYLICLDALYETIEDSSQFEKIIENRLKQFEKVLEKSGELSIGISHHFLKWQSYDLMKDFYEKLLGSVFSLENMLSKELRTKDSIIYTAYLFNVKVKS